MSKSNVTVIIPCYNDGLYIEKAVNSILSQTLPADEIIIVDDGSEKATKEVLKSFTHDTIKILTQENQGLSKARNNGIALAKTDYILTLDADDFFEPSFIEKAVRILNNDATVGIVSCGFRTFNKISYELKKIYTKDSVLEDFLFGNRCLSGSMFRKVCWSEVGGYDESMNYGYEDWEFWISVTSHGWKMQAIGEILYNYRKKETSMLKTAKSSHDSSIKKFIFNKHKKLYARHIDKTLLYFFDSIELINRKNEKLSNSIEYKIGKFFLLPLRFMKKLFQ